MKHNMEECTFIIPVKVDSDDRERNSSIVINYLIDTFDSKISIMEVGSDKIKNCVDLSNPNINYTRIDLQSGDPFHKTKYLNQMAKAVNTKVTCCYDVDVILPKSSYLSAVNNILTEVSDVVYPYGHGMFQKKVFLPLDKKKISSHDELDSYKIEMGMAIYGHCNFALTEIYKQAGFENESLISYGPEDQEKLYRFVRLGYKVHRLEDYVYHIEHSRGNDSTDENVFYKNNMEIYDKIKRMNDLEFGEYVSSLRSKISLT